MNIPAYYYLIASIIYGLFMCTTKKLPLSLLMSYIFLVIAQTIIIRTPQKTASLQLLPLWFLRGESGINRDVLNQVAANTVMFIPIGYLLSFYVGKYAILLGILLSSIIESVQFFTHRGLAETDDVISNTIGTIIGCVLFLLWNYLNVRFELKKRLFNKMKEEQ